MGKLCHPPAPRPSRTLPPPPPAPCPAPPAASGGLPRALPRAPRPLSAPLPPCGGGCGCGGAAGPSWFPKPEFCCPLKPGCCWFPVPEYWCSKPGFTWFPNAGFWLPEPWFCCPPKPWFCCPPKPGFCWFLKAGFPPWPGATPGPGSGAPITGFTDPVCWNGPTQPLPPLFESGDPPLLGPWICPGVAPFQGFLFCGGAVAEPPSG